MSWFILFIAGLLEICWAVGLKYTDGFSRFWPSVFTVIAMLFSVVFLAIAMKKLPMGTAYAVWTGIGTVGTVILGVILFNESANISRIVAIALILIGILSLKLTVE